MTFTASPSGHPFSGSRTCHGANHSDVGVAGFCDDCSAPVFKAAKGQLCNPGRAGGGAEVFYCWVRHECTGSPELKALLAATSMVKGNPAKGATVTVARGRKVAPGTVGVVRWVGQDNYTEETKVGLAVEGVENLTYVLWKHCDVDPDALAEAQALVDADTAAREAEAAADQAVLDHAEELRVQVFAAQDAAYETLGADASQEERLAAYHASLPLRAEWSAAEEAAAAIRNRRAF